MDYQKDDIIKFQYNVPKGAKGCPGPSGTVILKLHYFSNEIAWGVQTEKSPYPHKGNVRFYKKYMSNIKLLGHWSFPYSFSIN